MGRRPRPGRGTFPVSDRLRLVGWLAAGTLLLAGPPLPAADEAPDAPVVLAGQVVDEAGHPVAGATVTAIGREEVRPATTGDDGGFRLPGISPIGPNSFISLYAEGRDGRIGILNMGREKPEPLRIVLKPTRELAVRVRDRDGMPVADAEVEILAVFWRLLDGRTDADGRWVGRVPDDGKFWTVSARKGGVGFDYANNVPAKGPEDPLILVLDGARTVRVKTVDRFGKPVAGVKVGLLSIEKPGHRFGINLSGTVGTWLMTGEDGTAVFDWMPSFGRAFPFIIRSADYFTADGVTSLMADKPADEQTITLLPREVLSGRVTHADGRPAAGILVKAAGQGSGNNGFHGFARTDADGRYRMRAYSEQSYVVAVTDERWAAPYRTGVVVRAGRSTDGVDFVLGRATRLHGRVTIAQGGRGGMRFPIAVNINGGPIPPEILDDGQPGRRSARPPILTIESPVGEDGRYEFHLGPGDYTVWVNTEMRGFPEPLTIPADPQPAEIERDFPRPRDNRALQAPPPPRRLPRQIDLDLRSLRPADVTLVAAPDTSRGLVRFRNEDPVPIVDVLPDNAEGPPIFAKGTAGYRIEPAGLRLGAHPYSDREYAIRELPEGLSGLPLLQTRMGHKGVVDGRFAIVVSAAKPCSVFVAMDERALRTYEKRGTPSWLEEFAPTGYRIRTDERVMSGGNGAYRVFVRKAPAGRIALGPPGMDEVANAMYFAFFAEPVPAP